MKENLLLFIAFSVYRFCVAIQDEVQVPNGCTLLENALASVKSVKFWLSLREYHLFNKVEQFAGTCRDHAEPF